MSYPKNCRYCTITLVGDSEGRFKVERYWILDRQKVKGQFREHEDCHTVLQDGDYILAENRKRPGRYFESHDEGFNWKLTRIDWKGVYEVPQCLHTLQLDVSSMIQTEAQ